MSKPEPPTQRSWLWWLAFWLIVVWGATVATVVITALVFLSIYLLYKAGVLFSVLLEGVIRWLGFREKDAEFFGGAIALVAAIVWAFFVVYAWTWALKMMWRQTWKQMRRGLPESAAKKAEAEGAEIEKVLTKKLGG
jgi:hypothetical protein